MCQIGISNFRRIDVLIAGSDGRRDNALIIELKAWDKAGQ
jgi:hypothetical protein